MSEEETKNARIVDADITFERGFILDCWITLDCEGSTYKIGGYVLGGDPFGSSRAAQHAKQKNLAAEYIAGMMSVVGVERFSDLNNKIVRIRHTHSSVIAIGHPIEDKWFNPQERMAALTGKA